MLDGEHSVLFFHFLLFVGFKSYITIFLVGLDLLAHTLLSGLYKLSEYLPDRNTCSLAPQGHTIVI